MSSDGSQVFTDIKSRIRHHYAYDLLNSLQPLLYHPNATDIEHMRYVEYWNLLLLFKWIIQYGDFAETEKNEPVTNGHINDLLNAMKYLSSKVFALDTPVDGILLLRAMCFQQFWVQKSESVLLGLGRQYELFGKLETNHSLHDYFVQTTGVRIMDFLELSYLLFLHFSADNFFYVTVETFAKYEDSYPRATVEAFLKSISITMDDARKWLEGIGSNKPSQFRGFRYEFHEQTPFMRYPLIEARQFFKLISSYLLNVSLSTFIYDVLRDHDKSAFMDRFGIMFERYVGESLQAVSCQVLTERDLQQTLNTTEGQKTTDFLLVDNDNNIFIETKGVAMPWKGMVARRPGTVRSASKSSLLKGIEQAYDLSSRLSGLKSARNVRLGTKNSYLLIVTFKDMFIGDGRTFHDIYAPDEVNKILAAYAGKDCIPLSNIFFISIDELDMMLGTIETGSHTISDFVERMRRTEAMISPSHFFFRDLILQVSGQNDIQEPSLLSKAREELFQIIETKLSS